LNYPVVSYINRSGHGGSNTRLNGRLLSDIEFEQLLNADIATPGLRQKRKSPQSVVPCGLEGGGGINLCPTITLDDDLPDGVVGTPYSADVTATGGQAPYTYSVVFATSSFGLSFSSAGVLSGTPNAAGTIEMTVTATDANNCTGSRAYVILIGLPCVDDSTCAAANRDSITVALASLTVPGPTTCVLAASPVGGQNTFKINDGSGGQYTPLSSAVLARFIGNCSWNGGVGAAQLVAYGSLDCTGLASSSLGGTSIYLYRNASGFWRVFIIRAEAILFNATVFSDSCAAAVVCTNEITSLGEVVTLADGLATDGQYVAMATGGTITIPAA
jgi:hypothetical protein